MAVRISVLLCFSNTTISRHFYDFVWFTEWMLMLTLSVMLRTSDFCVCKQLTVSLWLHYVSGAFSLAFFFPINLFCLIRVYLFYFIYFRCLFVFTEREKESSWIVVAEEGRDWRGVVGMQIIISMYCMGKFSFQ